MSPVRILSRRPGEQSAAPGAASSPEVVDEGALRPERAGPPAGRMAIVVGVLAAVILMLGVPVRSWFVQRADLAAAQAQLAAAESEMADLERQVEQWRDPAYKERQARLRLNYVLPGEVGVVVVPPQAVQPGAPDAPSDWFAALWGSVASSAGSTDAESSSDPLRIRPEAPR